MFCLPSSVVAYLTIGRGIFIHSLEAELCVYRLIEGGKDF